MLKYIKFKLVIFSYINYFSNYNFNPSLYLRLLLRRVMAYNKINGGVPIKILIIDYRVILNYYIFILYS